MNRSRVCIVLAGLLFAAGCGTHNRSTGDAPATSASTAASTQSALPTTTVAPAATTMTTPSTQPGRTYSTQHFATPLDLVVPEWLNSAPQEDTAHFVTWLSPDGSRAVRILQPVEVYPPGSSTPTAPPEDFVSYILGQANNGAQFSDQTETEIDGHPATVVTVTTDKPLDGSVGCPEAGTPADTCFGFQPDLVVRIAVTKTGSGPLAIWLRLGRDAGLNLKEETARFADLLAGIRFANREPQAETEAAASSYDGEYQWTLTADDAMSSGTSGDRQPETLATYPWTFTLNLTKGQVTLRVDSNGEPPQNYRGTFSTDGDRIDLDWGGPTQSFTVTSDPDGTLHATAGSPMEDGDKYVMTTKPWTKKS